MNNNNSNVVYVIVNYNLLTNSILSIGKMYYDETQAIGYCDMVNTKRGIIGIDDYIYSFVERYIIN